MSGDVRVALVGAGRIAGVHAEAYRALDGAQVVACTDPAPGAADRLAGRYKLMVAPDLESLLGADEIDAVVIASPNDAHVKQALAALDAGKHVFCQKPLALTVVDADRVVAAAAASDRIVQVGHMLRFTPPLPQLHDAVQAGDFGELIASQAAVFGWEPSNDWFYDPALGGGVILDTLVHFADLVLWLLGPATTVHADGGAYVLDGAKRHGSPDNAIVTVRHEGGAVSSMYVTWTAGHGDFRFAVYGAAGSAEIDLVNTQGTTTFHRAGGPPRDPAWTWSQLAWGVGYQAEQQHFVDRIRGVVGSAPAATAADGRDALALVLAAQAALDSGSVVKL